jgi:hypothetical protein
MLLSTLNSNITKKKILGSLNDLCIWTILTKYINHSKNLEKESLLIFEAGWSVYWRKKKRICKVRNVRCDPKFAKLKALLDVCTKLMKTNLQINATHLIWFISF